jgi:hypothetical protein
MKKRIPPIMKIYKKMAVIQPGRSETRRDLILDLTSTRKSSFWQQMLWLIDDPPSEKG